MKLFSKRLLMALVFGIFTSFSFAQTSTTASPKEKAEYAVEDIQGPAVLVLEDGATEWEKAEEGQILESGDEIKTGEGSEVSLTLQSETTVHLGPQSDLKVDQIKDAGPSGFFSHLMLLAGNVLSDVKKDLMESHSTFEVESNGVVCGVRGTAFEVNVKDGEVETSTHEGEVEVKTGGTVHPVPAGNASLSAPDDSCAIEGWGDLEGARFHKWRAFREIVWAKRHKRLDALRRHLRRAWRRHHPHRAIHRRRVLRKILRKKPDDLP